MSISNDKEVEQIKPMELDERKDASFSHCNEDNFFLEQRMKEKSVYDIFKTEPLKDESREISTLNKYFQKTFKFCSYPVFGGFVLIGAIVSKACLMILVNSAKPYHPSSSTGNEILRRDHDMLRAWSYIIILIMLLVPEVLAMIYSLYRILMKHEESLEWKTLFLGGFWEFLHAIGEAILIVKVLPYLDATVALLMMPLIGIIPICINIHAKASLIFHKQYRKFSYAILPGILQVLGLIFCFSCSIWDFDWLQFMRRDCTYIWAIAGIILTSCRYWENFTDDDLAVSTKSFVFKLHKKLDKGRFKTSFIFSFMKCLVLVLTTFLIFVVLENDTYSSDYVVVNLPPGSSDGAKNVAYSSIRYNKILGLLTETGIRSPNREFILQNLWYVFATQVSCSFVAFFFGRISCFTMIQSVSYTLPLFMVTPIMVTFSAALGFYKQFGGHGLITFVGFNRLYSSLKPLNYYLDWNNVLFADDISRGHCTYYLVVLSIVGLMLGWVALLLLTLHLWSQRQERLERMEVLFVKPLYGGVFIDQTLILNRRKSDSPNLKTLETNEQERHGRRKSVFGKKMKSIPEIFLCATMWHETKPEMTQILTSIMRLDKYQNQQKRNPKMNKNFYNFQVHVMFDDAFETTEKAQEPMPNKFVQQLCELIPVAAKKVTSSSKSKKEEKEEEGKFESDYNFAPIKYPTPFGCKLEFDLPFGNPMILHLKNKDKIRHRKRWSQCMYMYYILSFLQNKKSYKLEDMFLLALDGDVDFQPEAVSRLLDRMKRNEEVGAACGRIHPTGSGPVVWFQKFEYAVGHWLQKTSEHVLGCVLCSPGCFSLFRAKALVDNNVIHTYTTRPSKALHYVQWDQGEDRWLCTLLLKKGYKIEYAAASDSYTFAPEDFKEFFNQRRRWGPSTMANIFDILRDGKHVIQMNNYISRGYIAYQIGLMTSSVLGPATVIMIVQGAYQYVFKWSSTTALIVSLIPVVIFIILCYTTSADTQVTVAGILTIIYALVMMAVVVGVIGSMVSNAIFDPNNLFMIFLVGLYGLTGVLHPQEMNCLFHGILYYLCVPSAFILLMVYSLVNMNNISWGTREVKKMSSESDETNQQMQKRVVCKPKGKNFQLDNTSYENFNSSGGYYSCGLGYVCQCALCLQPQAAYQPLSQQETSTITKENHESNRVDEKLLSNRQKKDSFSMPKETPTQWTIGKLDDDEVVFWNFMVKNYLQPIVKTEDEKEKIKDELKDLRNKMTAAFFLVNGLWIVLNFTLQLTLADIAISFYVNGTKLEVNPVQFAFLIFFLIILFIQFTCMLAHRWSTALHLLSVTSLKWNDSGEEIRSASKIDKEKADQNEQPKTSDKNEDILLQEVQGFDNPVCNSGESSDTRC